MALNAAAFSNIRPYAYHLTSRANLRSILTGGRIDCAATLILEDGRKELLRRRRSTHEVVHVDGCDIWLRDQAPLHAGNLALSEGWSFQVLGRNETLTGPFGPFLDPHTGVPLPRVAGQTATAAHAPLAFIEAEFSRPRPRYLVCSDQSHDRVPDLSRSAQRALKRADLKSRSLFSFYYVSHAPLGAAPDAAVLEPLRSRLVDAGIPRPHNSGEPVRKGSCDMPLPTGIWKINVNGAEESFTIEAAPNQQGVFSGRFLNTQCIGFWDEASQTITFTRRAAAGGGAGTTIALFKGYLFRSPPNPPPGQDVLATLAGFVQVTEGAAFDPAISTARRNVFGWFAQIPEVL